MLIGNSNRSGVEHNPCNTMWAQAVRAILLIAAVGLGCSAARAETTPPQSASSLADTAANHLARGQTSEAINAYSAALADTTLSNDRRATLLNDRGVAYARAGQVKLAVEDFNAAAGLFPE